jgi:Ser/Thr protein kinase RdoA (MazF antagonist)
MSYTEALLAASEDQNLTVTTLSTGLINKTFKVSILTTGSAFLLQEINRHVFPEPESLQDNYEKIWSHLQYGATPQTIPFPTTIPAPRSFLDGSFLFVDSQQKCWRLFEFIDKAVTIETPVNSDQAKKVAQTFGALTASFKNFESELLHKTIPGFHDLTLRFDQFQHSLHSRDFERLLKAAPIVDQLKKRERYVSLFEVMTSSEEFEKRLMHHDAKISNILFEEETGNVICAVDLDTCMSGYFFSDLGDMIRSMAASENEQSVGFNEIKIRKEYYDAIVSGYLSVMNELLTDAEKKYIHYAGLLMIYMQALRFITDYLNGDKYYRTDYPDQNSDRAKNQFLLLEQLENFLGEHYELKIS